MPVALPDQSVHLRRQELGLGAIPTHAESVRSPGHQEPEASGSQEVEGHRHPHRTDQVNAKETEQLIDSIMSHSQGLQRLVDSSGG